MDISEVVIGSKTLPEALDQAAKAEGDIMPMIEVGVRDGGGVDRKEEPVAADPGGGNKDW